MMDEGNIQRAFETMLPALFAKPLSSYRYGTEGLTNRQREVVGGMYADQFTATMLATTAIGFPPESVAMVQKSVVKAKEKDPQEFFGVRDLRFKCGATRVSRRQTTKLALQRKYRLLKFGRPTRRAVGLHGLGNDLPCGALGKIGRAHV